MGDRGYSPRRRRLTADQGRERGVLVVAAG